MTESTDIDALVAELKGFAAGSESARATLMRDAAKALVSTADELRKVTWRFQDAEDANADNMKLAQEAQANLARAREVIEKALQVPISVRSDYEMRCALRVALDKEGQADE